MAGTKICAKTAMPTRKMVTRFETFAFSIQCVVSQSLRTSFLPKTFCKTICFNLPERSRVDGQG
jgi:hypothetical protein